jgi:hypothetical protein
MTQGPLGIYGIAPPPPINLFGTVIKFNNQVNLFYLIAIFAVLVYIFLDNILRSPLEKICVPFGKMELSAACLWNQHKTLENLFLRR